MKISLRKLLLACVKAAIRAQKHVLETSLLSAKSFLGSVDEDDGARRPLEINVKSTLEHKSGVASADLVTNLDLEVQAIIMKLLRQEFGPELAIVGEEEDCSSTIDFAIPELQLEDIPCHRYLTAEGFPEEEVDAQQITLFIDPIDGTNAFVEGDYEAPMTLIGITVDGVPVAGVANKIFMADRSSLSFCLHGPKGFAVVWADDLFSNPPKVAVQGEFRVTYSATTKMSLLQPYLDALQPYRGVPARGAGNKLMLVACGAADCFPSVVAKGLKLWDTCAPDAFLRVVGGGIFSIKTGSPLPYSVVPGAYGVEDSVVAVRSSDVLELVRKKLDSKALL